MSASEKLARLTRRTLLIGGGLIGGGLLVGAGAVALRLERINGYRLPSEDGEVSFGAFLRIARDGRIEVAVPHQEMGQGIYALATLLAADGLRVNPDAVHAVPAPLDARFGNVVMLLDGLPVDLPSGASFAGAAKRWTLGKLVTALGVMGTAGSTSTRNMTDPIRHCAATTLDLLMRAASDRLGVPRESLEARSGRISGGGKSAAYAELAADAARLPPREIPLAPLGEGAFAGKGLPRPDIPPKARGQARYGIDTREGGQLFAAILHSPRLGGRLKRAALAPGHPATVKGLVASDDWIAVVATSFAQALNALEQAEITWDDSDALSLSTVDVMNAYSKALDDHASQRVRDGANRAGEIASAAGDRLRARYAVPFLAHATMEPINATARVTDGACEVWAGHQSNYLAALIAAKAAGCSSDAVKIHTPWVGGGFGRRIDLGYVGKAVTIAAQFRGTPVQTIWSRAEDIRDDPLRPAAMAEVEARIDASGAPAALVYRIAVPSVTEQFIDRLLSITSHGLISDRTTTDGTSLSFYGVPNRSVEALIVDCGVPVGFWRSVGYGINAFCVESFIDELAHKAGRTPLQYRRQLLLASGDTDATRRPLRLLDRLDDHDNKNPLPAPQAGMRLGRGFALTESFHSLVAQAVDVEVDAAGVIHVPRVKAVVDCGFAIDPPTVLAQVRGAINFGLSAALYGAIDLDDGKIVQKNFDSYRTLTLQDAPHIDVEIINSGAPIGGVGEIATPGIAPAVGNAVFAATGKRLRQLPFDLASAAAE